jgi:hypothetical protein
MVYCYMYIGTNVRNRSPTLYTDSVHDLLLTGEPNDFPLLKYEQGPFERMAGVALLIHKLAYEALITGAPSNRQAAAELALDLRHLLVQLAARNAVDRTGRDGIHRRELEETNGFVDMVWLDYGSQCRFGKRFGNPDDGLELAGCSHELADFPRFSRNIPNGDGNRASLFVILLYLLHLLP